MENQFYTSFDYHRMEESPVDSGEIRTPFQVDLDRIVFSYGFRRLQSKTQVFQSGEFDFYRTRLTHTIEVARIARSITNDLNHQSRQLHDRFFIDSDLVEAVGMAHDLGHPPFGHIGERKINKLMEAHGGFEGNAQTLRILTRLFYSRNDGSKGMNPSRSLVDGILKYKVLFAEAIGVGEKGEKHFPDNHFLYDSDIEWLNFALADQLDAIRSFCQSQQISINQFRSLECQIMDWADDTAYSINDIIDSIQAGYLTPQKIQRWAADQNFSNEEQHYFDELIDVIIHSRYEAFLNKQIGVFIHSVKLIERDNPMSVLTNRYCFGIEIEPECVARANLYKRIAVDLIFQSPQIHRIEYKGALILEKLFDALKTNYLDQPSGSYLNLIPRRFASQLQHSNNSEKMRILCDSISEMTDSLAIRTYKQLFDPDFGSILDII
jgi:dGTPase